MRPTRYLDHVAGAVQVLVDRVCVCDQVAFVVLQELVDSFAVVAARIPVKYVFFGGDDGPGLDVREGELEQVYTVDDSNTSLNPVVKG